MRKHKLFSHKKTIILGSIIVACLLATGAMAITKTGPFAPTTKSSAGVNAQDDTSKETPQDSTSDNTDTPDGSEKTPVENEPSDPSLPSDAVAASITSANQNGNTLQIRTLIEAVNSSGNCKLTLNKDGVTRTYTAGTQAQASTSTCKGFDVPISDLSIGSWNVAIDINVDGKTNHLTKTVTIN